MLIDVSWWVAEDTRTAGGRACGRRDCGGNETVLRCDITYLIRNKGKNLPAMPPMATTTGARADAGLARMNVAERYPSPGTTAPDPGTTHARHAPRVYRRISSRTDSADDVPHQIE
jgi:hypothetical protein